MKSSSGQTKSTRKKSAPSKKSLTAGRSPVAKPASRPRVKKSTDAVQTTAERARELGEAMTLAGEMLQEGAAFLAAFSKRSADRKRKS